jgi:hypothetical protein
MMIVITVYQLQERDLKDQRDPISLSNDQLLKPQYTLIVRHQLQL